MATKTPTLVLVHGAWHRESMWHLLREELSDLDVRTVQNPSSAPVAPSRLGDMYADAAAIRAAVESVGGPVVAVAHSYGGVPLTQALAGVSAVKRLVYLNAFMLDVGESVLKVVGGTPPPFWGMDHVGEGYYEMLNAEHHFYNDLTPEAARAAAGALGPHSVASMEQPVTRAAWHAIPSTYVIGVNDAAVPAEAGEFLSGRAERVVRMDTGHSPFLVRPAETAALLREELELAVREG
ncbi:alpha/beta hydrolase [Streptomyces sp. J2-1]|uniref:alpha/beta hydrolase n=1 Tax=Streptomyces corallincola TaxID=2851888 RepID=UPI001C389E92|nr:alpha/beta hydrolase [Streptomyces corallincola]MBV2355386.1 alpha/beta hydrolase [Streptomyces corallincola]